MLRDRRLLALLVAETISTTGSQMTWLALPWFVLVTTASATRMGFVIAAAVAGVAIFGLPGGSLLAKVGARRAMLLADGVRPSQAGGPLALLAAGPAFGAFGARPVFAAVAATQTLARVIAATAGLRVRRSESPALLAS